MTTRRRWPLTLVTVVALAASFAASSIPAESQTVGVGDAATLTVEQMTLGAAGGPFNFELSDSAASPLVQRGVATTTAEDTAIDIAGLGGDLAPATYTLRQDLAQLPTEPSGGQWEFTRVECDGATIEVDAPNATATIALEAGAAATCIVTNTWVADATPAPETTAPTETAPNDDSVSEQVEVPPVPDDVVVPLAIPPLDCSGGTIFQIQRAASGSTSAKLNAVAVASMTGTNSVSATQVSVPIPAGGANALGITAGGRGAWALAPQQPGGSGNTLSFTLYSFDVSTEVWTPHTANIDTTGRLPSGVDADDVRGGGIVAGAIDPLSGNYYWAYLADGTNKPLTIFGWNTTTNQPIGVVLNSTWPEDRPSGGGAPNGDIAFDRNGNLYVVSSIGTNAATGVINGPLPTTQQTPTPIRVDTRLATYSNPDSRAFNGIAFDNTGSLFIQSSSGSTTEILKINPTTGAVLAGPSSVNFTPTGGGVGVDLGACSAPPALQLQKNVINRQAPGDQFGLAITGGGITTGNTATTIGSANGVQVPKAGPVLGTTNQTYTFTETAAGTTTLANYTTTYQCVDEGANNAVVATGTGKTFNFLLPPPGPTQTGQFILCTFTNSAPNLVVSKSVSPASTTPVNEGQLLTYTLTFNNNAGGAPATVNHTDNLSKVLDDATIVTPPALATGTGLTVGTISGGAFSVTGAVPAGTSATVTFSVRVNTPDTGDHQLDNFVVPTGTTPPATCVATNPACTTHPVPALVVAKTSAPASTTPVVEGQLLTYTLTFANTAGRAPATVNHTDNLSKVLDDATVVTPPALATGSGLTVSPISGGGTFTVTGAVAAGASATVTFSVRVNTPDTGDHQLDNFVVPTGTPPPATCLTANTACTTHPVPALVVSKSVVPSSTTPVVEGQVLTYTLTFANTAGKAPATVNHTDNLSKVLDDATLTSGPTVGGAIGLTVSPISGGAFTVTGTVAAGATSTVTFSVTVNTPDTGDHQLDNFVVPTGTTPPATCLPANTTCTTNPVPALVVTKSVVPASTTPVAEGQLLTYTLTFANTAGRAPATVNHTDDLSKVLDDATVVTQPALATGSGLIVSPISGSTFTVTGAVAAGATATVTFSVRVNTPDTGDHRLDNFVVPTGTTPPATCLPANTACTTNPVPALVVTKSSSPSSTTPVAEGQLLTYTLTFANTAGQAPATVNHTDNLSRVLDDATVTTPPALASGTGLTVSGITGGAFTVTGTVAAGATATVTFSVTVNTPDTGDHQLDNFVVPTGTTTPPNCLPTNPACTTNPVPALVVTKSVVPASTTVVNEGDVLTYTLTFANTAGRAPATVNHIDDLSRILDDATVTTQPAVGIGTGLTVGAITGGAFSVTGTVAAGATATVTFAVTVNTPDTGDHQLDNFVVPTGTPLPPNCLPTNPACTTNPVPALVVTKSAVPTSTTAVNEGDVVTYTLTFANTAGRAPATVNHTDDLSRILDDATVTTPPALASGSGLTVGAISGNAFTVTGAVAAGATATVTFSVTVNDPDTGDHRLDNFVVPTGTLPPTECLPTNPACTTHPVPALVVSKSSVPASTTAVNEGDVVTYTLTFANTAGQAPAPVDYTDDLSRVLDDATVTTPPALASGSGLTVGAISGGAFTVTGAVPAGTTATVTFSVTVNDPDTGDHRLDNFVVPTGTTPPADCLPADPACTTHPVPALVVSKSSVPASTTPVAEGQVLTYTLTFANTAGQAPAPVDHTDDLSRVLDDATLTTPPALATGTGLTVGAIIGGAFTVTGAVPAGTTTTVTFAVTVNTPDTGDHQLDNFVVPTGTPPPPNCLPADPTCTTNPVPALVVTKSAVPTSTTPVNEGDVLTYTLTFANTAGRAPATVNHTDDLSRVLDDATVTTPPTVASGIGLTVGTITGGAFTITGTVPAGATSTVTFSVTVNTPDTGDHQLDNFVVPTGTTPPLNCLPADLACTTHPVPALVVTKSAVPTSTTPVNEGDVVTYTLTFANTAGRAPAPVDYTDDLSRVLDDATVTTPPALATGTGLTVGPITGGAFTVTGAVPPGTTATVTFSVTVNAPDTGDHQLDNFVVPTGTTPPATCVATNPACTTHPVPALVVAKSAVPTSTTTVNEGDVVTYTLTFSNTAGRAPAPVNHTDDLSRVLDDATVTTPPALATGSGLTVGPITSGAFTVTGAVPPGTTATVTFSVTVNTPDTGDHQLDNFVVPTGTTPPATCVATNPACTTHPVPALVVTKSAVPTSTTPVAEGQLLTYTLTFANTAGQAPAPVNHTDDLSRVLDDATLTTPPVLATGTGLTVGPITGGAFTVTGAVPAGTTATVTFAVTVNTPDTGDHQLDNFVVPTGTPPPPNCLPADPTCTTNPVPALVVTKSAVPSSTTTVNEGDVVTYTLTFANTAGQAPAPVDHTDDLSRVLDDATVTTPPALASGTGLTVGAISGDSFTVTGAVPAGTTATVTFAVTVNTPDTGDHRLDNFVVPTGTPPPTECVPANTACTTHPVPALVVSKSAVPSSTTPVAEGQVLTYTLTFANTAGQAPAPVDHTDDLSRVLDDATVTTPPALASGTGLTVGAISGDSFTVTGAVPAGTTATVTFAVTVNTPDTGDHRLDNFVVPTGTPPPSECLPANTACTTHPVPALVVSKSAVPSSTTTVNEGDVVTYTLTFENTAGQAPAPVNHTDDLLRVLDDATVTTPPALASGTGLTVGAISGDSFTVTGAVPAGTTATVTFAVTVNTPDTGDHRLDNFVVPTGSTPPTECVPANTACTTHPVPALVVTKSAAPASTTSVAEGQLLTYTLTFANTAGQAPAPVDYTDDLSLGARRRDRDHPTRPRHGHWPDGGRYQRGRVHGDGCGARRGRRRR